jgi:hypothetical protein
MMTSADWGTSALESDIKPAASVGTGWFRSDTGVYLRMTAIWAALLLLLAVRVGWVLLPLSICLAGQLNKTSLSTHASWASVLLLTLTVGWAFAMTGFVRSFLREVRFRRHVRMPAVARRRLAAGGA